jgi:ATP-dependent DNA helicase RecG
MAWVSFLRLAGKDLASEVITSHDMKGPLPRQMDQIDELLRLHGMTAVDITSGDKERREPIIRFPHFSRSSATPSCTEFTRVRTHPFVSTGDNDRVESAPVVHTGGLLPKTWPSGINDYRNPNLAEAMRCLGYAQNFGVGIRSRAMRWPATGTAAGVQVDARTVVATLRRTERGGVEERIRPMTYDG